ncbi:MAG: sigma 54-interacting transcriptional regulator [candidate division Zixibacteria bacterium]|nr:sigma 54-interacting transcriptional regulator [candidate division Zixibacteria bacterium]
MNEQELICKKLLTIVDSISDGVIAVDNDWHITFLNKAAERITGFKASDAINKPCHEILRTNVCQESCPLKHTITTGTPVINRPVCITTRTGRRLPISVSTALLKDSKGQVIGGVETFRDLDLVKRLRKEFESQFVFENMLSRNQGMLNIFETLPMIAESESPVLIEGESGTGKELIAHALHDLSPRKQGPFISINCGALPDNLLESELFGYMAGAFTDAKKDKKGRFALAEKGTLFLDEIGNISQAMQIKLLRVLQEKTYEPLGSTETIKADVRIVTATNRLLSQLVSEDVFRNDLYYRINVIKVSLPPLRDRIEDIPLLTDHFVDQFNRLRHKDIPGVSPPALKVLMNHDYPGNIRELENIIEHAFILCGDGIIKPEHLPDYLHADNSIPVVEIASTMKEMESLFIMATLKRNNWSRKETAKELGIAPSTLFRKIKRLNLIIPSQEDKSPK